MIWVTSRASDYWHNRAWLIALGFAFQILGFAMLLGGKPEQHSLRYAALVFATIGVGSMSSIKASADPSSHTSSSDLGRRERWQ